jgi:hypothetical protein
MTTANDLKKEFNCRFAPLELVADKILGIGEKEARKKYYQKELPFPAFFAFKSQRAKILVDVHDLADYLDKQALIAREGC